MSTVYMPRRRNRDDGCRAEAKEVSSVRAWNTGGMASRRLYGGTMLAERCETAEGCGGEEDVRGEERDQRGKGRSDRDGWLGVFEKPSEPFRPCANRHRAFVAHVGQ